jgi:hypothetical protein
MRSQGLRGLAAVMAMTLRMQVQHAETKPRQPKMTKAEKKAEKRARRAASKGEQA